MPTSPSTLRAGQRRSACGTGLQLALLLVIAIAMLVPLLWLVSTSLKGDNETP